MSAGPAERAEGQRKQEPGQSRFLPPSDPLETPRHGTAR